MLKGRSPRVGRRMRTRNVKADNQVERKRKKEGEREREEEAITKFFRSCGPFLLLSTLHAIAVRPLSFEPLCQRRPFTCPLIATVRHFSFTENAPSRCCRSSKWILSRDIKQKYLFQVIKTPLKDRLKVFFF